jgi:hypothetical protein
VPLDLCLKTAPCSTFGSALQLDEVIRIVSEFGAGDEA